MKRTLRVILSLALIAAMLFSVSATAFAATSDPVAHDHNWVTEVRQNPTCTEDGSGYTYCSICGQSQPGRVIPALGHDWRDQSKSTATCTEGGTKVVVCNRCGLTYTQDTDPLGHDWGEWKTTQEPGNDVPWTLERVCKRCGLVESKSYSERISMDFVDKSSSTAFVGSTVTGYYTVTNNGTHPVSVYALSYEPTMINFSMGENSSYLMPGESMPVEAVYNVTEADINGFERSICAYAAVWDVETDDKVTAGIGELSSNYVSFSCDVIETEEYLDVSVIKWTDSKPANGEFFTPGETITYNVAVINDSDVPVNAYAYDPLDSGSGLETLVLEPHMSRYFSFNYTVTVQDAVVGRIVNSAVGVFWTDRNTLQVGSNRVVVETGSEERRGLSVTKSITSTPLNKYYVLNETISFAITVKNTGTVPLYNVIVNDKLSGSDSWELISYPEIAPGESETAYLTHIVTASDVERTYVDNVATSYATDKNGIHVSATSNHVVAPTAKDTLPPPDRWNLEEPIEKTAEGDRVCERLLIAGKDRSFAYSINNCSVHSKMDGEALKLSSDGTADGWKAAANLWREEMDNLYRRLYNAAPSVEISTAIMTERTMFVLQLQSMIDLSAKEFPNNPEIVAQREAEALKNKVTDLCWILHVTPAMWNADHSNDVLGSTDTICALIPVEQDAGHLLCTVNICETHTAQASAMHDMLRYEAGAAPEHYTWEDVRGAWTAAIQNETRARCSSSAELENAIIADSCNFDTWLESYEAFISVFYPDQASADKAVALAAMERCINNCGTPEEQVEHQAENNLPGKKIELNIDNKAGEPAAESKSPLGIVAAVAGAALAAAAAGFVVIRSRRKNEE